MSPGRVLQVGSRFAVFAPLLFLHPAVHAGGFAVGREVLPKTREFSLTVDDRAVACQGMLCPFRICKIDGDRLYLAALGKKGWAPAGSVVLVREAETYFSTAIRTNPRDSFAYLMRGIARAEESPDEEDSLADFDEAIRLDSRNVAAYLCRGLLWLQREDIDRSLLDFNAALQIAAANPYALVARGICLGQKGATGPAAADFEKAFSMEPRDIGPLLHRGWLWQSLRKPDRALADFDRCRALDPSHSEPFARKAAILVEQGDFDRAIPEFDSAIRLEPENPRYYLERGNCRFLKGKETGMALADFDTAIRIDGENADAYRMRALAQQGSHNFDQAISDISQAIVLDPGNSADLDTRGTLWELKGQFDRALADYTAAIRLDGHDAQAYYQRALVLDRHKDLPRQAIEDLTDAIRIDPKHIGAIVARAWIYQKSDFDKAMADFSLAIKLEPKDAALYISRGTAWEVKRFYRQALADFDEAVRLAPDSDNAVEAYIARAMIRATCPDATMRNGALAVESATRACTLTAWHEPGSLITLAVAYAEKSDFDSAVQWAEKAVALAPENHPLLSAWRALVTQFKQKQPVRGPQ
jgi:tetratricopeptide (TPR) repeat protein